jgi:hypothetical protein
MSRLIKAIRGIGWLILVVLLGSLFLGDTTGTRISIIGVACVMLAGPFFLVAWIIDGFVAEHRARR